MGALWLLALVLVLLALRQNLLVILGTAVAWLYLYYTDDQLSFIALDAWGALNKEVLLSIPLFILAGNIMAKGGMALRLVRLVKALTGPVPGGLAIATVVSCAIFAAISGSGTVTLLAVGAVMYPALLEAGYDKRFSLGSITSAGTLGIIVPPSIPLILYGVMTHTSIADLFIAGIGPALLLTGLMAAYAVAVNWQKDRQPIVFTEVRAAAVDGILALLMPVIILGGIYTGHFTATESAAVAVVYALLVEVLLHRELDLRQVADVMVDTGRLLGGLFPVLMLALALNVFFTYQKVPEHMVDWLSGQIDSRIAFLLIVNVFLLVIGCIMDIGSAILILAPMLVPLAEAQGIDPVHFGIIMVVNLEIGYLTPPLGLNLIVALGAFRENFWEICRAVVPFLLLMLAGLSVVSFWPELSLFLIR
ncbi:MAG: TRAP transporter large permease [Gammaproteobacteria bacterium]